MALHRAAPSVPTVSSGLSVSTISNWLSVMTVSSGLSVSTISNGFSVWTLSNVLSVSTIFVPTLSSGLLVPTISDGALVPTSSNGLPILISYNGLSASTNSNGFSVLANSYQPHLGLPDPSLTNSYQLRKGRRSIAIKALPKAPSSSTFVEHFIREGGEVRGEGGIGQILGSSVLTNHDSLKSTWAIISVTRGPRRRSCHPDQSTSTRQPGDHVDNHLDNPNMLDRRSCRLLWASYLQSSTLGTDEGSYSDSALHRAVLLSVPRISIDGDDD
ncbi:hypothetical protein BHE74_00036038 [Ensete ventricosum]|nr:hypothetical protein BHE74_00036038 [Ensete ventricosum]